MLYGLLDMVVDGYFDAIEVFDEYYDAVSDGVFLEHPLDPPNSVTGSRCAALWPVFTASSFPCAKPPHEGAG